MPERQRDVDELALQLLILRCQAGDQRAFERLMDQFHERTLRYLRGLVGDAADDVQQEVWLAVYRGIAGLAAPRAFRTWLFRTTRHRAIDFLRRVRREGELLADVDVDTVPERAAEPEPDATVIDLLGRRLDALPAVHREVLLLRYRDDMSYEQIALVIGCSVGTVRSRLHYAKQRLHEAFKERRT